MEIVLFGVVGWLRCRKQSSTRLKNARVGGEGKRDRKEERAV